MTSNRSTLKATRDYKAAWRSFYSATRKAGDIKDVVVQMKETGLLVKPQFSFETRDVNWKVAQIKLRSGELDFGGWKDKVIAALQQTGWGKPFLAALQAQA